MWRVRVLITAARCTWRSKATRGSVQMVWRGGWCMTGLRRSDANGTVQPALAIAWESDDNYHRWHFRLRPGVHFHDGSAVTSLHVVASLTAACSGQCPWTAVRAVGPSVVFTNDSPMPNLPALLASDQFLIALTTAADGKTAAGAIGTGPFQAHGL